jgi:hypothetical protein
MRAWIVTVMALEDTEPKNMKAIVLPVLPRIRGDGGAKQTSPLSYKALA